MIPSLKIAGAARGLNAKVFANLGDGAATLSLAAVDCTALGRSTLARLVEEEI